MTILSATLRGLSHADDESRDAAKRPYLRVSAHRAGSRRQIKNKKKLIATVVLPVISD